MKKGRGVDHDFLHLHYRSSGTLLAMGADPIDALRQMKSVATDPYSGGRNFCGHSAVWDWNVAPITSPIEVQHSMAVGTAIAQKRAGGDAITIVQGGDAGTAEGDFASCLVWAGRPALPLPMLVIVTNNGWGIDDEQHRVFDAQTTVEEVLHQGGRDRRVTTCSATRADIKSPSRSASGRTP